MVERRVKMSQVAMCDGHENIPLRSPAEERIVDPEFQQLTLRAPHCVGVRMFPLALTSQ